MLAAVGLAPAADAAPWQYGEPITIAAPAAGVFHHLESAGRKSVAVGGDVIAITWEDNRSGAPQIYVALVRIGERGVSEALQVSTGGGAYEPAIAAVGNGNFVIAWEQEEAVWVRALAGQRLGVPQRLAGAVSAQASLAADGRRIMVVWSERRGNASHIAMRELVWRGVKKPLEAHAPQWVDTAPPDAEQFYPAVVLNRHGTTVAWEDRRHGHTALLVAHAAAGAKFGAPRPLIDKRPQRSTIYGKGPGAARPVLTPWGRRGVAAAWLDKRDFTSGYDTYAGLSEDGGRSFGRNEKVQDEFGNAISQWHAAAAGDANGQLVIAWDDNRDDTADIWIAWRTERWSGDHAVPGATGAGEQSSPAVALDGHGGLHLAWIDRSDPQARTAIKYIYAPRAPTAIENQFPSSKISPSL